MNAVESPKPTTKQVIKTTLFDLMSAMQQHAATPQEEALIVPTVVELLRCGRLRFDSECPLPTVA